MSRKNKKAPWEEEEEIIWVSKSEMKRDMEELQKIGEELVELKPNALAKMPLDEDMMDAIKDAQRFTKEARRRQLQYIGKQMRFIDIEPIEAALDKLRNKHSQQTVMLKKLEQKRDKLIENGDSMINAILVDHPHANRQHLRQLVRQAGKEKAQQKPGKAFKEIFQYLKELYIQD
ncbi:ribosome biogenesis factor YjgA [Photobacterium damselae subsp. piscicida]|nr:ribosome biogenesis factor YjgA [Photobacterium damselae subsp. piscicida]